MVDEPMTIEYGDGNELNKYSGRTVTVVRVIGPFAIVNIDGVGQRGILTEFLQPKMTADAVARQFQEIKDLANSFDIQILLPRAPVMASDLLPQRRYRRPFTVDYCDLLTTK